MHGPRVLAALVPITLHALVVGLFPNMPLFDGLAVPITAYLLVRLAPPLSPRQRWLLLFGAALVFQLGVFRQVWHFGEGGRHALVGGVIPWSDAGELLTDALRKVHGEDYDVRSTTRPMYPAIFGLVFYLTGEDVRLTLLVFAAIGLGLVATVTNEVWTARGPKAAAIALTVLLFFARRFFIVIGTETLGFVFGAVAFLFLWRGSRTQGDEKVVPDDVTIPAGVLFLSLGIVTRAGPMLAPLAVVIWVWRTIPAPSRLGIVVRCVAAMVVAFAVNTTLVRTMGEGLAYADFPPILYGVLHGEDQKYVLTAHPEILALEQPASSHAIMALVASEVRTQPWLVVTGALRSMGSFVAHPDGLFSLVFYDPDDLLLEGGGSPMDAVARFVREAGAYRALNLVAMALAGLLFVVGTVVGAVRAARGGSADARSKLLFYVAVSVLLSSAVTPAWTSEAVRLQAATLCFLIALATTVPALRPLPDAEAPARSLRGYAVASAIAVVGMYVIAWSTLQARPRARVASCRSFERLALVPSTLVEIAPEAAGGYTPARVARNVLYLKKHNPELSEPIAKSATAGMGIEVAYDACAMKSRVLLHPADALRRLGGKNVRIVEGEASKEGVIVARTLAAE